MTSTEGYTVSNKAAFRWLENNQAKRDDGRARYMVMERRDGFGVWDVQNSHWVYVQEEQNR